MGGFHFCRETVYGISLLWYQLAGLPRNSMYDGEIFNITLLNIRIKFSVHLKQYVNYTTQPIPQMVLILLTCLIFKSLQYSVRRHLN